MSSRQERRNASQVDEHGNLIHSTQNLGAPGSTGAAGTTDPLGAPGSTGNTTYQPAMGGQQQLQHRPNGEMGELQGQYRTSGGDRQDSTGFTGGTTGGVGGRRDTSGLAGGLGGHDTGFGGGHQTAGGGAADVLGSGGHHTTGDTGEGKGYTATCNKGRPDLTSGTTTGAGEYGERDHTTGYGTTGTGVGGGGCGTGTLGTEGMPATDGRGVKWKSTTQTTIPDSTGVGSDIGRGEHCEGDKKGLMGKIKDSIPGTGGGRTRQT